MPFYSLCLLSMSKPVPSFHQRLHAVCKKVQPKLWHFNEIFSMPNQRPVRQSCYSLLKAIPRSGSAMLMLLLSLSQCTYIVLSNLLSNWNCFVLLFLFCLSSRRLNHLVYRQPIHNTYIPISITILLENFQL